MEDARLVSRLMFEARERLEMDIEKVERIARTPDTWGRRLLKEIDDYRAEQGWSPHGFGGEPEWTDGR